MAIDVPGKPASEAYDEWLFNPIESMVALHHRLIMELCQRTVEKRHGRAMIFTCPGAAKSTYASVVLPTWLMGNNKGYKIILASYGSDLAKKHGRKARQIARSEKFSGIFGCELSKDSSAADEWALTNGSEYMSGGILSGITGSRANCVLIDDPVKGRSEAESEAVRKSTQQAYEDDLKTRLIPGGAIILIQCMVGDTPVLMSDGSEKKLKDILVGDFVASYDNGKLVNSKVLNSANQGVDCIFTINTTSRKIVKANERHPFLIYSEGSLRWKILKNLKCGDKIVSLKDAKKNQDQKQSLENANLAKQEIYIEKKIQTLQEWKLDTTENGKIKNVQLMNAKVRQKQKGCALITMIKTGGIQGIGRHHATHPQEEMHISGIDTELISRNIIKFSKTKMVNVLCAENYQEIMSGRIGEESYALTIAIKQEKLEDFFAMTAISQLDMEKKNQYFLEQLNTSDFTLDEIESIYEDGYEEVYDIQVERTENFIANGIVSHNTRWHPKDLSGSVLPDNYSGESGLILCKDGFEWDILNIPAQCERDGDPLGREIGEYIWPEWFDEQHWNQFKSNKRTWSALYQQRPIIAGGDLIKGEYFKRYKILPKILHKQIFADTAQKTGERNDYSVFQCWGMGDDNRIYLLDQIRGKWASPELKRRAISFWAKHVYQDGPFAPALRMMYIEDKSSGSGLIQQIQEEGGIPVEAIQRNKDKYTRWLDVEAYFEQGMICVPDDAPWIDDYISEHEAFTANDSHVHDDQIDPTFDAAEKMLANGRTFDEDYWT